MNKPKKLAYQLIDEGDPFLAEIEALVADLRETVHDGIADARIASAWMIGKKPDKDGRIVLGKMKKASELDRQMHEYDAVLLLNREHWEILSAEQRRALVDHDLCHLDVDVDEDSGEPKEDEQGRKLYRLRQHDITEFRGVIERHGCYVDDLREFVRAALKAEPNLRLFDEKSGPRAVAR